MNTKEISTLLIALVTLTIIISFKSLLAGNIQYLGTAPLFAFLILLVNIGAKKWAAYSLDADVEHDLWYGARYGLKPGWKLEKKIPLGIIVPLAITAFSLGVAKCMTILSYETSALKRRAARRFGYYSFTEMTDWHNALVGAAGIIGVLILAIIAYTIPALDGLTSLAVYYAFWNMIPWSKLDGAQIFIGSRILYTTLALLTLALTIATLVIA